MMNTVSKPDRALATTCLTAILSTALGACAAGVPDPEQGGDSSTAEIGTAEQLAAANAAILANPVGTGSHCEIMLEKIQPGQSQSRVVSYTCAETKAALASMTAAASATLLMEWWVDRDFGGDGTAITGKSGPCDSAGYGIQNVGFVWNDLISSFKSFSDCNRVLAYVDINYGGAPATWWDHFGIGQSPSLLVPYVGNPMNDKISSFHINRQ